MKTDTIIKQEGINALISKLGYVDAERFIVLITKEPFDYTKWREQSLYELFPKYAIGAVLFCDSPIFQALHYTTSLILSAFTLSAALRSSPMLLPFKIS